MKSKVFILLLICFSWLNLRAVAAPELFNLKNIKKEFNFKANVKKSDSKPKVPQILRQEIVKKEPLRIIYVSNVNLFVKNPTNNYPQMNYVSIWPFLPNPVSEPFFYGLNDDAKKIISRKLVNPPEINGKILYKESQLLLQETIREILKSLPIQSTDLVVYGGNQVYSTEELEIFLEINLELQKYQVPFYQVIGENELKGSIALDKFVKDRYYILRIKNTNILVLDNAGSDIVPVNLPEEATKQYIWLKEQLDSLSKSTDELLIFSYKPLSKNDIEFFNSYPSLNLKLVVFTGAKTIAYEDKQKFFTHKSKPLLLSGGPLSSYPCSYLIISRDELGKYKVEEIPVDLPGIREIAKQRM